MDFILVRNVHIATVGITLTLFLLRYAWMLQESPHLQARWVKIFPHVNDTVLLVSGIGLAVMIRQYPFVNAWLTAKLFALLAYIVLGTLALKRARNKMQRAASGLAALAVFAYLVMVAVSHSAAPWTFWQ